MRDRDRYKTAPRKTTSVHIGNHVYVSECPDCFCLCANETALDAHLEVAHDQ